MRLQTIPLGTTLLSSNLKVGLLAGIVGVTSSTGAVATAVNSSSLSSAFSSVYSPVKGFFNNNIDPHFKTISDGVKKIGGKLKNWADTAYSKKDSALNWVKDNFSSSTLKSGLLKITDQTRSWATSGKSALLSTYSVGRDKVFPFLSNSENMRGLLYHGSEITNILKALGALLTASAFSSATGGANEAGPSGEDGEEDEDGTSAGTPAFSKFWQLVNNPDFSSIVSSVWDLITNNLNVVQKLSGEEINRIVSFVLDEPNEVKTRIDGMKKPKSSKDNTDSPKWGSYSTPSDFMNALFPPELVVQAVIEALKSMAGGQDLTEYLEDTNKAISDDIVKSILGCKSESDSDEGNSQQTCPKNATITTVLTELLKPLFPTEIQSQEQDS